MAFKMAPRSPLMKSLKGGQKNLPEGLKKAIEAAPGKMMDSPAKMGRGEKYDVKMASDQNLTAGARKNYAENAEAAQKSSPAKNMNKGYGSPAKEIGPKKAKAHKEIKRTTGKIAGPPVAGKTERKAERKNTAAKATAAKAARRIADGDKKPMPPSSPAKATNKSYAPGTAESKFNTSSSSKPAGSKPKYDKELNSLVASRKGMTKGTAEYNRVQNQINSKLGSKVRRKTTDLQETVKLSTKSGPTTKAPKLVITPARPPAATGGKDKSVKINQTAAGTTMTTRTGGGANKGGTTEKRKVNKNRDKTITKTANTRTVTTRRKGTDSADNPVTKTTKRLGKGRIKEAIANRKAKVQATRAAKRKSTSTQNKMDGLGK